MYAQAMHTPNMCMYLNMCYMRMYINMLTPGHIEIDTPTVTCGYRSLKGLLQVMGA